MYNMLYNNKLHYTTKEGVFIDIKPWITAIHRTSISAPLKNLLENNRLNTDQNILDYGCGHGFDLNYLKNNNFKIEGFDKYIDTFSNQFYYNNNYDVIICLYVFNTISEYNERVSVLKSLISLLKPKGKIFLAVRSIDEFNSLKNKNYKKYKDGIITSKGTFQKYFTKNDLEELIHNNFSDIKFTYIPFNNKTLFIELYKTGDDLSEN